MFKNISLLCFISVLLATGTSYGASSPESFAEDFVKVLNSRDQVAFSALLFPKSRQAEQAKDSDKFQKKLKVILSQKSPAEYSHHKVVITDISQDKDYNIEDNTIMMFGSKTASFPVKLQKRLTVYVKEGQSDDAGEWTLPITTQVLAEHNGEWFMVWPERIQ